MGQTFFLKPFETGPIPPPPATGQITDLITVSHPVEIWREGCIFNFKKV